MAKHKVKRAVKAKVVLTIFRAHDMPLDERLAIATWLNQCAQSLVRDGHRYASRVKAQYP